MYYTDDEINDTIQHMGYEIPQVEELEKIKNGLLEFNDEDIDELINYPFAHDLAEIHRNFDGTHYIGNENQHKEHIDLLNDAYEMANDLYTEILDIEEEIEYELSNLSIESREFIEEMFHRESTRSISSVPEPPSLPDSIRKKSPKKKKESFGRSKSHSFELDENNEPKFIEEKAEQELIDEILRERGIRRVHCPEPGRAPYKHDPVARNNMYQKMWKTLPIPDDKRRKALRWKIRELMMRKDMPVLKLVPNRKIKPKPIWVD